MTTGKIAPKDWQKTLDQLSITLEEKIINVEVAGLDIGDQIEASHVTLRGLTYDPKSDAVQVIMDELDHTIKSPKTIYYTQEQGLIESIEIVDVNGRNQIITFV